MEEVQNIIESKLLDEKCEINKILPLIMRNKDHGYNRTDRRRCNSF